MLRWNAGSAAWIRWTRTLLSQMKAELINELNTEYQALREKSGLLRRETISLEEAQKNKLNLF